MSEWIPKDLWLATQFACKMIRENGWFNKACETAANYYGVDTEDVKKQVRLRQSKGQKNANKNKPKKSLKYYVLNMHGMVGYETEDDMGLILCKGYNKNAVEKRYSVFRNDYDHYWSSVLEECDTQEEAIKKAQVHGEKIYGENWKINCRVEW